MQVTIFGKSTASGFAPDWSRERVFGVFGPIELDLAARQTADEAAVTAFTVFGGVTTIVPAGSAVSVSGFAVFGSRSVDVARSETAGPRLKLSLSTVFGGVSVRSP